MKTQTFKHSIIQAIIILSLASCSEYAGDPITKTFDSDLAYTELSVSNAFDVVVSDTATRITVTAGENVMPNVVVTLDDNKLKIYLKNWSTSRGSNMKVILPYNPDLVSLDLSGASEFYSDFGLRGSNVDVELSGASDCYCTIEADNIDLDLSGASSFFGSLFATNLVLDMSGASDAKIDGTVDLLKLDLSGSSTLIRQLIDGHYAMVCNNCEGSLTGSSEAYLHSDGWISVSLSGASDLHYTGSARTSGSSTTGGSTLQHDSPRP